MGTWQLYTVPPEAGTHPQLLHCPSSSPNTSHLAAAWRLPWPKMGKEDKWRVRWLHLQLMGILVGGGLDHYTKSSNPFFNSFLQGVLIFLWGKPQVSWHLLAQEPLTAPHLPSDAQGAAEGGFSFTFLYLQHLLPSLSLHTLSPNHAMPKGLEGCWSMEDIFLLYSLTSCQSSLAPPLLTPREKDHFVPPCIASSRPPFSLEKEARGRGHSGLRVAVTLNCSAETSSNWICVTIWKTFLCSFLSECQLETKNWRPEHMKKN